jgi:hypothetical protein
MVNGAAVLEYGNHLPSFVRLNESGRLIADMGVSIARCKTSRFYE